MDPAQRGETGILFGTALQPLGGRGLDQVFGAPARSDEGILFTAPRIAGRIGSDNAKTAPQVVDQVTEFTTDIMREPLEKFAHFA